MILHIFNEGNRHRSCSHILLLSVMKQDFLSTVKIPVIISCSFLDDYTITRVKIVCFSGLYGHMKFYNRVEYIIVILFAAVLLIYHSRVVSHLNVNNQSRSTSI